MTRNYYDLAPESGGDLSSKFCPNFTSFQNNISSYYYHEPTSHARIIPMVTFSPSVSCDNSRTPDEADENQKNIINERKRRRMVSNRESARRARMRKQRQLEELCTQVTRLRSENHGLMVKLNRFLPSHEQVIQENDKLKKEALELRKLLSEAQLASTYASLDLGIFRDDVVVDDDDDEDDDSYAREIVPTSCSTAHRRAQSSHKFTVASTTSDSSTLLH